MQKNDTVHLDDITFNFDDHLDKTANQVIQNLKPLDIQKLQSNLKAKEEEKTQPAPVVEEPVIQLQPEKPEVLSLKKQQKLDKKNEAKQNKKLKAL